MFICQYCRIEHEKYYQVCPKCHQVGTVSRKTKLDILEDKLGEDIVGFLKFRAQKGLDNWGLLEEV